MINAPDSVIELEVDYLYYSDGLRKGKTVTTSYELSDSVTEREYSYVYNGSQLTGLTVVVTVDGATEENHVMRIGYDISGPMFIKYNDLTYQYVTNLQGDVIALLDHTGAVVVEYTYDAWGNILSITGSKAATLGEYNPLRYRGYVYDTETQLYYLQSRYYDPNQGRFINADVFYSTGQGLLGNNMFAYCLNNPVCRKDALGTTSVECKGDDGNPADDDKDIHGASNGPNGGGVKIYRYGYDGPKKLVPSEADAKEDSGVSFSTKAKPGSAVTTIEQINSTGKLYAVQDGDYHVSVYPIGGTISQWYSLGPNSPWTIALESVVEKN